jgi:hypothetical protein
MKPFILFDRYQSRSGREALNREREFLRHLYGRSRNFAAPRMTPECLMDSTISLLLMSLIGLAAFAFGYLARRNRRRQGTTNG